MNIYDEVYKRNLRRPDKLALSVTMDDGTRRSYTYGQTFETAQRYADRLLSAGLRAGDRVAFICEGSPEWTIAFFAVAKIRCTAALIDASLLPEELRELLGHSDVRAAFLSPKTLARCRDFIDLPFPIFNVYDCELFEGSREKPEAEPTPDPNEDVAAVIYSSGTTRKSAGIMHSHDSLINTTQMTLDVQRLTEDDRFLAIIPNSHIYGVICLILGPHLIGADVHYIESLSAEAVLSAFREYHPTILSAVPKIYEVFRTQILNKIDSSPVTKTMFRLFFPLCLQKRYRSGSLLGKKLFKSIHEGFGGSIRIFCSAGAPLSREVAEFYYGTGFNLLITYGASETNIPTVGNTFENLTTDSCGRPYPAVSLKFSDEGEILIKSPYVMKGYFHDEEATKAAFDEGGWFRTGDLGYEDENGNVHVTGRLKENIVLATGKKIAPEELERAYTDIEGAKEFVICGVPSANAGCDEVYAFVVPNEDTPEANDALREQIRQRGAEFRKDMRITHIRFVRDIPRTALQKPKRYLLREQALLLTKEEKREKTTAAERTGGGRDMESLVFSSVAKIADVNVGELTEDTRIFADLPIDSLSAIGLALDLEDRLHVNIEQYYNEDMTIGDLLLALKGEKETGRAAGRSGIAYPQDKSAVDYHAYCFFRNLAKTFHKVTIRNAQYIPSHRGFIICANHVSKIDALYISSALSREQFMKMSCMAKKELFRRDPFSRRLIKAAGMVPVDRGGINRESMQNLKRKLKEKWCVIVFVEGTRSPDGLFRSIKSGAAKLAADTGAPLIPVYIDGMFNIFPKGKKTVRIFDWKHMKKLPVTVTFGKPISPRDATVPELTLAVRDAISELQDENCTLPGFTPRRPLP